MKKLSILLLALFFIGITNINAQTDAITTDEVTTDEVKKECPFTKTADGKLICTKTGKICDPASCKNKSKCCKGKSKKSSCSKSKCCKGKSKKSSCSKSKRSSCSKSKNRGFNYNKSNNYGNNTRTKCSAKKVIKCGENCRKSCCNAKTRMTAAEERIRIGIANGSITEEEGKTRIERMKERMKEKIKEE